ncbi:unnamed protein product [Meloidogyne enterolobii]|uniref:Uncharacterized protein n=1 Tax=Meloidogyne enterolobii TaxID=390850 RepID=A0ACB0XSP7_MELEN
MYKKPAALKLRNLEVFSEVKWMGVGWDTPSLSRATLSRPPCRDHHVAGHLVAGPPCRRPPCHKGVKNFYAAMEVRKRPLGTIGVFWSNLDRFYSFKNSGRIYPDKRKIIK